MPLPDTETSEWLAAATPETPVRLGAYDVVGRLGQGGMGTVYAGVDRARGSHVAIKTLRVPTPGSVVALKREFRAVADLSHPNLAPVYELGCERDVWFIVMARVAGVGCVEWARGVRSEHATGSVNLAAGSWLAPVRGNGDPKRKAARVGPPVREYGALRRAFAGLVRGLAAMHEAGLRHGDVKPSNILIDDAGRAVLVDFGLTVPVDHAHEPRWATGGTPLYMAPEQIDGNGPGPSSDWYAVGTVLYEALTGRLPFEAESVLELYFNKMHRQPRRPAALVTGMPSDLSELCMALLHSEPDHRPDARQLLHALDADETASVNFDQFAADVFVGREDELAVLEEAYARARSGALTVAHVHGRPGIGKSALARSFLKGLRGVAGARVLRGRCYERETVPYKGFDDVIDALAVRLSDLDAGARAALVPDHVGELLQVFPALGAVDSLADAAADATTPKQARELRRRGWKALCRLLERFAHVRPLVVWIDDLQWADADTAGLVRALADGAENAPLLLLLSYRPEEAADNAVLLDWYERAAELEAQGALVDVPLTGLKERAAATLARTTLADLGKARLMDRAEELAEEAAGVPLFIEELARYIAAQGEADVTALSLEDAIAARLHSLPLTQRALVEVCAVADNPIPQSLVFEAAGADAGALPDLLALRNASLLRWMGAGADDAVGTYHDRIRESVLTALGGGEDRRARHLGIGRALAARHAADRSGPWLYDAVRHLRAASPREADGRLEAARLHLEAGRRARAAAAFPLACRCFEGGVQLLPDDAWSSHYRLALGLHSGAAEGAYLTADWENFETRVAEVEAHARTPRDQLQVREVEIDALIGRHQYQRAVDRGREVLALFDVNLPAEPGEAEVGAAFQATLAALQRVGPAGLEALPDADDPDVLAMMRIQVRMSPAAYFGKPLLLPIIACRLINSSVERGLSTATPYALALFGIVLNTVGMYPTSHAWGQLAVKLLDRWPDRSLEAATRHVVFNLVCPWMVPMPSILAPLREVFDIGRRIGDYEYAAYAAHGYTHNAIYAGRPLEPLLAEALELGVQMDALGQVNALHIHTPFEQLLKALTGRLTDPACLDDHDFDEERLNRAARDAGSRSGVFVLNVVMGLARFHFGRFAEASTCLETARAHLDAAPSVWHVPILHQFAALSACALWSEADDARRDTLRPLIDLSLEALRALAGHAPVNFAHRVKLVEGELRRLAGDRAGAIDLFQRAIEQAGDERWLSDIGLANELIARCLEKGVGARAAWRAARASYDEWGASAKVDRIDAQLTALEA